MKCPHCLVAFHVQWEWNHIGTDSEQCFELRHTVCPACHRMVIAIDKKSSPLGAPFVQTVLVYPKTISRAPIPSEVPQQYAVDYKESCLVLADSSKASAALGRRVLQHLLREEAKTRKKDLAEQIQEVLDSGKLPSQLAEAIDAIRIIGNFAAHPLKSTNTGAIVDVEPGEAEWLLDVLEGLFDFYFVQPAILQKKKAALNQKLQEAGKPLMK